ncbi:GNAT family N-acetyltransferase [Neobacillus dielmonensis]|uniref:GNAT family N-acetyltransferase n=1 Tax=Neobacillus dielmonensis TaxID=1347369 RepID=UPI0005AADB92|nr:GNAT family protein [Neobacillus dielmonensis]
MKLVGTGIYLRYLEEKDAEAIRGLYLRNRDFFQKYSPKRQEEYYTLERRLRAIQSSIEGRKEDKEYAFGIFLKETDELIGDIDITGISRDVLQSGYIGYSLDQRHNGRGYTTEAVILLVHYGFNQLKLHRLMAGVMPANIGSQRVLEKAGFQKEGIARKNVKINGTWEDHIQFSILEEDI